MLALPQSLAGLPVYRFTANQKVTWAPDDPYMLYGVTTLAELTREVKRAERGAPIQNSREDMLARLRRIRK